MSNNIDTLPPDLESPFGFREKDGDIEGYVPEPKDILDKFEPIDVLNGVMELVDQKGSIITFHCDDPLALNNNKYPDNYKGIYYTILNPEENDEDKAR